MKIMRADLDGINCKILYSTGLSDEDHKDCRIWCVGIAVDEDRDIIYWSQKGPSKGGEGKILGMSLSSVDAENSTAEPFVILDHLPEPIDLEFEPRTHTLYWTDRGDPPFGNSVNAANLDAMRRSGHMAIRILVQRLHGGIAVFGSEAQPDVLWRLDGRYLHFSIGWNAEGNTVH